MANIIDSELSAGFDNSAGDCEPKKIIDSIPSTIIISDSVNTQDCSTDSVALSIDTISVQNVPLDTVQVLDCGTVIDITAESIYVSEQCNTQPANLEGVTPYDPTCAEYTAGDNIRFRKSGNKIAIDAILTNYYNKSEIDNLLDGYAIVGGTNGQVQYNDSGDLNGLPLLYDNLLNKLTGATSLEFDLTGTQDFNINATNGGNYSQYYLNDNGFNTYVSSTGSSYESGIEAGDDYVALYSRIGAVTNFATFNNTEAKLTWLEGTGNRMVTADALGVLGAAPLTYDSGLFTLDASWTANLIGSGIFFKTGIESGTEQTEYYQNSHGIDLYAQSISGNEYSGIGNNKDYIFLYAGVGATENYIEIAYNYVDISALAGTGTEMVVVNSTGRLARQSIATPYTDTDARAAISETITGIDYNNTTGVFSLTSGYVIPTTTNEFNWNSAYVLAHAAVTLSVTGLTLTGQAITTTAGYAIPTTTKQTQWDTVYTLAGTAITAGQVIYAGTAGVHSGSANFTWSSTNNQLLIGNPTSPASTTRVAIKGTGTTSDYILQLIDSTGVAKFSFQSQGLMFIGNPALNNYVFASNTGLFIQSGNGGTSSSLTYSASNSMTNVHIFNSQGGTNHITGTSGAINLVVASNGSDFAPTSGTMNYTSFKSAATINQTGTATGLVRAFWVNDVITSITGEYRAFGVSPTSSINLTSGAANLTSFYDGQIYNMTSGWTGMARGFYAKPFFTGMPNFQYTGNEIDLGSATQYALVIKGANGETRIATKTNFGTSATPTALVDINGATGYNQLRLRTTYTPTSSADANGNIGDICIDGTYVYWKVATTGWLRAAGVTF